MNGIIVVAAALLANSNPLPEQPAREGRMVRVLVQQASPLQDVPFIMRFAQELRGLDGVSVVRIEIARSEVLVTCDPARLAPEDLPGKLTERGYRAAQVPAGDEIE